MIYIQTLNRYWDAGSRFLKNTDPDLKREFQIYLAQEYARLIKLSIDLQRYKSKWKDLTPGYSEYKRKHGLSNKIWEATGELKNSLRVSVVRGKPIVIGFDKRKNHKGTRTRLWKIAVYLEYGTFRIPPRPLFRQVYVYMSSHIEYFWDKFVRELGQEAGDYFELGSV